MGARRFGRTAPSLGAAHRPKPGPGEVHVPGQARGTLAFSSREESARASRLDPRPERRRVGNEAQHDPSRRSVARPTARQPEVSRRMSADSMCRGPWTTDAKQHNVELPEPYRGTDSGGRGRRSDVGRAFDSSSGSSTARSRRGGAGESRLEVLVRNKPLVPSTQIANNSTDSRRTEHGRRLTGRPVVVSHPPTPNRVPFS